MVQRLDDLPPHVRDVAAEAVHWFDRGAVRGPLRSVRAHSWHALGLLLRDGPDDTDRALVLLDRLLGYQFDEPGTPIHGTWHRATDEAHPPTDPVVWRDYDPNWRQFIGTALAIVLEEYRDRLPPALAGRIDQAIALAIDGEPDDRCSPRYTNIALMKAGLNAWGGMRYGREDWLRRGEELAAVIHQNALECGILDEYNAPTYYGVNLYALGFWRRYAGATTLGHLGMEIENLLWRDIAALYHAGLRNLCGPWARSYGMDMRRYVAILGQAIWMVAGRQHAPHPDPSGPMAHAGDMGFPPCLAHVGLRPPTDALPALTAFPGEHTVHRAMGVGEGWEATAWLSDGCMVGAAHTRGQRAAAGQFHPLTAHWRVPGADGDVGWLRMSGGNPSDSRAERGRLEVLATRAPVFQVWAPDLVPENVQSACWRLPGLTLDIAADSMEMTATVREDGSVEIAYPGATRLTLHIAQMG